jgi:hypothetical protein
MTSDQALALVKSAYLQKDATALAQLRAAAQSGDANAQFWLGVMYLEGLGVPQDYAQAISWYRKAAAQGHAHAQFNLGLMYDYGQGVPQDSIVAYALYNLSATGDPASDNHATSNLSNLTARMTPKQIAAGQELTRRMSTPAHRLDHSRWVWKRACSRSLAFFVHYSVRPSKCPRTRLTSVCRTNVRLGRQMIV